MDGDATMARSPAEGPARALGLTALTWVLLLVAVVTLAPFRFEAASLERVTVRSSGGDLVGNAVLLFVPGFLYRLATGVTRDGWCIGPLAMGLAFSALLEASQLTLPGRWTSPLDLVANAGGAWFGALVHDSLRRNVDPRLAGRLFLELPLMGLVYLLTPLLWLHGLAGGPAAERVVMAVLLGLVGSTVLAAVTAHRLRPVGGVSPNAVSMAVGAWFLVSTVPVLQARSWHLAACALGLAIATRVQIAWLTPYAAGERRFEAATLARVAPVFLGYLLLLTLSPVGGLTGPWRGGVWFAELGQPPERPPMLRVLEYLAACAVGGYALAEWRGRDESRSRAHGVVLLGIVAGAAAMEILRGFHPAYEASVLRGLFAAAAGLFGAAVHSRHLAAVRVWSRAWRYGAGAVTAAAGGG